MFFESSGDLLSSKISITNCLTFQASGFGVAEKFISKHNFYVNDHKTRLPDDESIRFRVLICMNIGGQCAAIPELPKERTNERISAKKWRLFVYYPSNIICELQGKMFMNG